MFCAKCGKELKEGARFCPACGTAVRIVPADPAAVNVPEEAPKQTAGPSAPPVKTAPPVTPPVFTAPGQPVTQGPVPPRKPITQGPVPPRKPVTQTTGTQQEKAPEKKKISPVPFIIGGSALLLLLIAFGIFVLVGVIKRKPSSSFERASSEVIRMTEKATMEKEDDAKLATTLPVEAQTESVQEELTPETTESAAPETTTEAVPETSSSETEPAAPAVLDSETASDPRWYEALDDNIAMMENWADYLFISLDEKTDKVIGFGYVRDDGGVYDLWVFTDPQIAGEDNVYRTASITASDAKQFVDRFFTQELYKEFAPGGRAGILWDSPYGLCGYVHSAGEYSGNIGALGYLYDVGEITALHDRTFASSGERLSDVAAMVKSDKQN